MCRFMQFKFIIGPYCVINTSFNDVRAKLIQSSFIILTSYNNLFNVLNGQAGNKKYKVQYKNHLKSKWCHFAT